MRGRVVGLSIAAVLFAACASAPRTTPPAPTLDASAPTPVARASTVPRSEPTPATAPQPQPHVFVIVMENTGLARALRAAPIASLASRYATTTGYRAVA